MSTRSNKSKEDAYSLFKSKSDIKNEIISLRDIIDKEQTTLDIINNRRSTFYEHYDPDKKFPPEKLNDLKVITIVAKKNFDRLYGKFYNTTFLFSNTTGQLSQ